MITRLLVALAVGAVTVSASAAPTLHVDSNARNEGNHLFTYFGQVHNDTAATIYITGDAYDFGNSNATLSDTVLRSTVPIAVAPGATFNGPIFTLLIKGNVPSGSGGSFTVTGGTDSADMDNLASDSFLAPFPFDMSDAIRSLRLAAGLAVPNANDVRRLNDVQTNAPASSLDMLDAISIARKASGATQNP